jgi:membrane protein YqaA with SNARE-associated domain
MDKFEAYSYLLGDSLMGALLLPPRDELVFSVMHHFGGYDAPTMITLAVLGSTLGFMVNYLFGRLLRHCKNQEWIAERSAKWDALIAGFQRYGMWLLPFAFVPVLGGITTLAAGIFCIRLRVVVPLVIIGRIGYYLVRHHYLLA